MPGALRAIRYGQPKLPRRAVAVLPVMWVKRDRHIPLHCRARLLRVGVQHHPAELSRAQGRFGLQHLLQTALPQPQTERQGRRAGPATQIQRKSRVLQRILQLLQKGGVLAFQPGQKHGILQIMAIGHIRVFFILRLYGVVIHQ